MEDSFFAFFNFWVDFLGNKDILQVPKLVQIFSYRKKRTFCDSHANRPLIGFFVLV